MRIHAHTYIKLILFNDLAFLGHVPGLALAFQPLHHLSQVIISNSKTRPRIHRSSTWPPFLCEQNAKSLKQRTFSRLFPDGAVLLCF